MTSHPSTPPGTPCAGGVPAALLEIRHQLGDLAQTMWAARQGEEPIGWASTQDFLTDVTGGREGSGAALVRLAKALELPLFAPVGEALSDGWLSRVKDQVIVRNVDELPGNPEIRGRAVALLLDEAKGLDATDLAKAGRRIIETVDPDGQARREEQALAREERAAHLNRDFWLKSDGMGGFRFGGRGSAEDEEQLRTTLMSLSRPRPNDTPPATPPPARSLDAGTTAATFATTARGCSTPSSSCASA